METYLYLTVRIIVVSYILYRLWVVLFIHKLYGLWDRIPVREKKPEKTGTAPVKRTAGRKVVGRTNKVFLDDPRKALPEPVGSIDLEPTGFIGQDEPFIPDEEEAGQMPYTPSEDELYDEYQSPDDDTDFSTGVTFDELSEAADVLQNGTTDDEVQTRAAKTVYNVRDTEIFDFLANEVSSKMAIEKLLTGCLDGDGIPLKRKKPQGIAEFDIDKYT